MKKRVKQFSSFGLFLFLLLALIGGTGCQKEDVEWKEGIEGSVFRDFETILYVDTIPETVDKENAVYLYYQTEKAYEYDFPGYFHYPVRAFGAAVHDGKKYSISNDNDKVKQFMMATTIPINGVKIYLSGYITRFKGITLGGDAIYLLEATNIKAKEE